MSFYEKETNLKMLYTIELLTYFISDKAKLQEQ
jgi:hypothetical protein